jgi:toxin ParE1/3/4
VTRLTFSPDADADLEEIGDFIAEDNPDAAIAFVQRLRRRCHDLLTFPAVGRKRDEIRTGYRNATTSSGRDSAATEGICL